MIGPRVATLLLLTLSTASSAPPPQKGAQLATVEEDVVGKDRAASPVSSSAPTSTGTSVEGSTTFNAIPVPKMKELGGETFKEDTKDGYWYANPQETARRDP